MKFFSSKWKALTVGLALFSLPPQTAPGQIFTRVEDIIFAEHFDDTYGVSWGDYDSDGLPDLFVSNGSGQPDRLYHNDGLGTFTEVPTSFLTFPGITAGGSWADYDNDGYLDLFVANLNGATLYRNHGDASFSAIDLPASSDGTRDGSWADFDGDGDLDLVISHRWSNTSLLVNNGDGTFAENFSTPISEDFGNSTGVSWADFDNDGDQDLLITNTEYQTNFFYVNNGNGTFTKITESDFVNEESRTAMGAWGDYDNDGDLDLILANTAPETCVLYRNDGSGSFTKLADNVISDNLSSANGAHWVDFDNDGDLDLFLNIIHDAPNLLYENNGLGGFSRILGEPIVADSASSYGAAWADYDRDGDLDLIVGNQGNYPNVLYRNEGNANHWLHINLIGRISPRSAYGARVYVHATINGQVTRQLREVSGEESINQSTSDAAFGLGDATQIDSLIIRWPSGLIQTLTDIAADQRLTIHEPATSILLTHTLRGGEAATIDVYLNDTRIADDVVFQHSTVLGVEVTENMSLDIVAGDRADNSVPLLTQSLPISPDSFYTAVLSGTVGQDNATAPTLFTHASGLESAKGPRFKSRLFHGLPGSPSVAASLHHSTSSQLDALSYGDFGDAYAGWTPLSLLRLHDAEADTSLASFALDVAERDSSLLFVLSSTAPDPDSLVLLGVSPRGTTYTFAPPLQIAAARAAAADSSVIIEGIITRSQGSLTRLQDTTAAITIAETGSPFAEAIARGDLRPGDHVLLKGTTTDWNHRRQLTSIGSAHTLLSRNDSLPSPVHLTLAELEAQAEAYESRLVRVDDLQLVPIVEGNFDANTGYVITDSLGSTSSLILRVPPASETAAEEMSLPFGRFSFVGVVDQESPFLNSAGYQLALLSEDDLIPHPSARVQWIYADPTTKGASTIIMLDSIQVATLLYGTASPFQAFDAPATANLTLIQDDAEIDTTTSTLVLSEQQSAIAIIAPIGAGDSTSVLVYDNARLQASNPATVDLLIAHVSPDAPAIDLVVPDLLFPGSQTLLADDLEPGTVQDYISIEPGTYDLHVVDAVTSELLAIYSMDLTAKTGQALTMLAMGRFDDPVAATGFSLSVASSAGGSLEPIDVISGVPEDPEPMPQPTTFALHGNSPNPFSYDTRVLFDVPEPGEVWLEIFDLLGRRVLRSTPQRRLPGALQTLDVHTQLAPGIYFYRLSFRTNAQYDVATGNFVVVR